MDNDIKKNTSGNEGQNNNTQPIKLDDTQRVKVLSPGALVFKRFMRSKLAIAGSIILIFMFAFTFLGGLLSPYTQSQIFFKYGMMERDYAVATVREDFNNIIINNVPTVVRASINSYIKTMKEQQKDNFIFFQSGNEYHLEELGDCAYILYSINYLNVGSLTKPKFGLPTYNIIDNDYDNDNFINKIENVISENPSSFIKLTFEYNDVEFTLERSGTIYTIKRRGELEEALVSTNLVFDRFSEDIIISNDFRILALKNAYGDKVFSYNEKNFIIKEDENINNFFTIYEVKGNKETAYANMSQFVVRRIDGTDTLQLDFKLVLQSFIADMKENGILKAELTYLVYDEVLFQGEPDEEVEDPDANPDEEEEDEVIVIEVPLPDVISETTFRIERRLDSYVIRNQQERYLIDIYGRPSAKHWLGTDSNGMDVLTRMMHGGRISLMIGFIVIFIELIIGVILGGVAGYFGKWVDNLIMRLVDIFNCIPFLPVLIIIGTVFDKMQVDPYERIMYLMIILGVLGWPGIARLVRGQILSLREQEFMIAAEATGISSRRRIFKHLVPNVMPQLIVTATMTLGGIIITESTLSFLGLGAKYPLATWGAMINSVSDASSLVNYSYIWIPVGLLICLTVIAFNFVGDGLRDAFDPKMKK